MVRMCRSAALCVICVLMSPAMSFAQAGNIAGVVRDSSGAVLPGVTVEAASPALIERVRSVTTDTSGQYKIIELRPGNYSVTFSLAGFNTVKRDGIELRTDFTATVNAELTVGALQETVVVTGASPTVDIQNVRTQSVITSETLNALPTNKSFQAFTALTVGATSGSSGIQDVGGNKGEDFVTVSVHGGNANDQRLLYDGMRFLIPQSNGQAQYYKINQVAVVEVAVDTAGLPAEAESGGIQMNMVPREGGNTFSGLANFNFTNDSLQSDNLDDELRARGLQSTAGIRKIYDVGMGIGGPIIRDRIWFFGAVRKWASQQQSPGNYWNKTQGTPVYTPDLERPAYNDIRNRDWTVRGTWRATDKHRITYSSSHQRNCICLYQVQLNRSPEASNNEDYVRVGLMQATWSYPATDRLLFQAGFTNGINEEDHARVEGVSRTDRAYQELSTGYTYGARAGVTGTDYQYTKNPQTNGRLQMAYVTGSHAIRTGFAYMQGSFASGLDLNDPPILYGLRAGVPSQITLFASPSYSTSENFTYGLYVQDQWTLKRLTVTPGLRFDHLRAWNPDQTRPAGPFVREFSFARVDNVPNWKNTVARVGAAYDLFGTGKTAIKGYAGKFVAQESLGLAFAVNRANAVVQSATRQWQDLNGDFNAQEDELGPLSNSLFGTVVSNTTYDPSLLSGVRPYNWQTSLSVQQELRPGVGMTVGYFRTWHGNFRQNDNTLVTPDLYDPYCITAPVDERLPGGGGYENCGLYDIRPSAFGRVNTLVRSAEDFGKQSQVYNGVDVLLNARFGKSGQLSGGFNTGQTVWDNCFTVDSPQTPAGYAAGTALTASGERAGYCRVVLPMSGQTQIKLNGAYLLPWDLQLSGVFQNLPGPPIHATYPVPNALIAPSLGRNVGACGASVTCTALTSVDIIEPYTMFENRLTQIDARLAKVVKIGASSLKATFDAYNLFNANTILIRNNTYGATWGRPTDILGARLLKFGAQLDF